MGVSSTGGAGERDPAAARVDGQVAHGDRRGRGVGGAGRATEHGPDARLELSGLERLEHVVVGAGVERLHHALVVVAGGGDDDRHRGHRTEHAQQLPTVEVGQPEVEDHQVGALVDREPEPLEGGAGRADGVAAVAQGADQRRADAFVVLDDQEVGHGATLTAPSAPAKEPSRALTAS